MTLSRRLFLFTLMTGTALPALPTWEAADPDVVIVGAGAAGLAAAKSLTAANKAVVVVEARERIGGRAVTDSTTFGFPFDLGGTEASREEYARFEKIAVDASGKLVEPQHAVVEGLGAPVARETLAVLGRKHWRGASKVIHLCRIGAYSCLPRTLD